MAPSPGKYAKEDSCSYHGVSDFPSLFMPPPGVHPNGKLKCGWSLGRIKMGSGKVGFRTNELKSHELSL